MGETVRTARPSGTPSRTIWLVAASLYFLFAASTIHLTSDGRTIATVWPANAVLVALLLLDRRPRWWTVLSAGLVGNVAANWLTRGSIVGPLLYAIANGLEVVVATILIRRGSGSIDLLRSTGALLRFILAAGLIAPALSGAAGAATATLVYDQAFVSSFKTWFLSDGLGLLVFTPVFMAILGGQLTDCIRSKSPMQRLESLAYLGLVVATAYLVFYVAVLPALFLLYAPVMLVTFRVGPLGTKMAVMAIAVIGACATASGHGPVVMTTGDPVLQAHLFQSFLAIMLITCLPVAAEIAARTRLSRKLEEQAAEAHAEAITDTLTGLLNRRGFERRAGALLDRAASPLCCVAIDIDHFKGINDSWGHPFGDHVLRHLAATLRANTRPDDLIGRLGGDEFVMILQVGDHDTGEAICTRIQAALRQQPIAADAATHVLLSISCGIAGITPPDRLRDVIARADDALYRAKAGGRNGFRSAG